MVLTNISSANFFLMLVRVIRIVYQYDLLLALVSFFITSLYLKKLTTWHETTSI